MRRHSSWVMVTTISIVLVACGSAEEVATTSSTTPPTTAVLDPATTTTTPATTTTTAAPTTTVSSGLPGDPIDFGPVAGDILAAIGVAHDDVLNLRLAPGADQAIVAEIPPLYSELVAMGATRQLAASMWIQVDYLGLIGWVNLRFIAYLGATNDVTAQIVSNLGETPVAESMLALGLIVAESILTEAPDATLVMSAAPTVGDLGEVTYDIVGSGDDSVSGSRIHVFGQPVDGGFSLQAVEASPFCSRGLGLNDECV
ncbi:MAG: hypothetical protein M3P87_09815 [Actinomycetota bacterium]|nr:hypothetical protein [Actinomycetota bacterium]